MMLKSTII